MSFQTQCPPSSEQSTEHTANSFHWEYSMYTLFRKTFLWKLFGAWSRVTQVLFLEKLAIYFFLICNFIMTAVQAAETGAVLGSHRHLRWQARIRLEGTDGKYLDLTGQPHHLPHLPSSLYAVYLVVSDPGCWVLQMPTPSSYCSISASKRELFI